MQQLRQAFSGLVASPGDTDALEQGALLIALQCGADVDRDQVLGELDQLAVAAAAEIETDVSAARRLEQLGCFLHDRAGFAGNRLDYYDPENSFLNRVLERRLGIPISLAVVYIAVARRVGLTLHGLGFPGHFLLGCGRTDGEWVLDPFTGQMMDDAACQQLVAQVLGRSVSLRNEWFEVQPTASIWFRMLGNLRRIFMSRGNYLRALECCDWQLMIEPRAAQELLDRGLLLEQLGNSRAAHAALRHFLLLHSDHQAAPAVRVKLTQLRRGAGRLLH